MGLSIAGPGSLTADPVPEEITRCPAFLSSDVSVIGGNIFNGLTITHNVLPLTGSDLMDDK